MSLTQTPDNNSDFEGVQISSGPTSRTTTGQFTGIMSLQEQFESFIKTANQEKENEIQKLKDENERLKEEVDRLKQKASDPQGIALKNKASELKKILDEFLDPNRTIFQPRLHHSNYSISLPNGNVDVNKSAISTNGSISTNENKFRPGPADEPSSFHMPRSINYNNQEDFGTRQEFRPESDAELINQATQEEMSMSRQHYSHHSNHPHNNLPTAYNLGGMNQKRFNNYNNGLGGTNNNNNNNRNRNNHNNNSNKYTIFISWPGPNMTKEQLQELFDSSGIDIADIRYTSPKQFAHVDLKSENALNKAMALNGVTKHEKQGALRVEHGKPRNNNNNNNNNNHPTENGQRPQNQNKSYNRQNNKNSNYNNNSPQKQNGKYPNYNHNNSHHTNHNNHNSNSQYQPASFTSDEKESGTNSWHNFSTQETSQNIE